MYQIITRTFVVDSLNGYDVTNKQKVSFIPCHKVTFVTVFKSERFLHKTICLRIAASFSANLCILMLKHSPFLSFNLVLVTCGGDGGVDVE